MCVCVCVCINGGFSILSSRLSSFSTSLVSTQCLEAMYAVAVATEVAIALLPSTAVHSLSRG